jgi:hypothetical protein
MEFNRAYDPIRALQSSWKALSRSPLPLLVGGVLLTLFDGHGGGSGPFRIEQHHHVHDLHEAWMALRPTLPFAGICCCFGIAIFLFGSWVRVGFANTVESVVARGRATVGQLFESKGRFGNIVFARIVVLLIHVATTLPLIAAVLLVAFATRGFERHEELAFFLIPAFLVWFPVWVYVALGLSLVDQAAALEGLPPVDCLKRSWSLVSGHRWMLLLYWIVGFVFSALGCCLCCIGVFLTNTLFETAKSESYLALVRGGERASWWIEAGDPPAAAPVGWGAVTPPPPPAPSS